MNPMSLLHITGEYLVSNAISGLIGVSRNYLSPNSICRTIKSMYINVLVLVYNGMYIIHTF